MVSIRTLSFLFIALAVSGCEFTESAPTFAVGAASCAMPMKCDGASEPLATCNAVQDAQDCLVLQFRMAANEPDPMIFKAQMAQESGFNVFAVSPDSPCGVPMGWTDQESKSFGLMQLTPACNFLMGARLPNGHPNLEKDMTSALWATSVFNPLLNVQGGVQAISSSRTRMVQRIPDCTETQYTMMALSAFNQGGGSVTGCGSVSAGGQNYVNLVMGHYRTLAGAAGWPNPY